MFWGCVITLAAVFSCSECWYGSKTRYEDNQEIFNERKKSGNLHWPWPSDWEEISKPCAPPDGLLHYQCVLRTHKGCMPFHITQLFRHGTRNPSNKDMKKGAALRKKLLNFHLPPEYEKQIREWNIDFQSVEEKILTEYGSKEMFGLGKKTAGKISEFPTKPDISYTSSRVERAQNSARSFSSGLNNDDNPRIKTDDKHMRFFEMCHKYNQSGLLNERGKVEKRTVLASEEAAQAAQELGQKLGGELKTGDLVGLYKLCWMERVLRDHREPVFCPLLSPEARNIVEFLHDIKHYWKRSYGYEINYSHSCGLFSLLTKNLVAGAQKYSTSQRTSAEFYFAHAETLLPIYALLGLFNDSIHLTAQFSRHLIHHRQFRATLIVPFAANLQLTLFRCKDATSSDGDNTWVSVSVNDHPVGLPGPEGATSTLVRLSDFLELYSHLLDSCDVDELCENSRRDEL